MVSNAEWDALSPVEKAFMINGTEIDILPGVWGDIPEAMQDAPLSEMTAVLLSLVDRDGWIGALTLVETEAGRQVTHMSADEVDQ